MLIVCEGPMGAGKTSLTRLLAKHFSAPAYLERPQDNPFLADLYAAHRHALATELHFLLERSVQWQALPAGLCCSDHAPDKDLSLARKPSTRSSANSTCACAPGSCPRRLR
ncbi:MAG: deoxynucleoside kinase [Candidatus Igneacidithiobacillus chanchocoensis]